MLHVEQQTQVDPLSEYWQSERRNLKAKMYKVVHFYILIISFPVQGTLSCKIWFSNESVPIMVKLIKGIAEYDDEKER